jgi:hypothetical protein
MGGVFVMRGYLVVLLFFVLLLWTLLAAGCEAAGGRVALSSAGSSAERSERQLRSVIMKVEYGVRYRLRPAGIRFRADLGTAVPWPLPCPG